MNNIIIILRWYKIGYNRNRKLQISRAPTAQKRSRRNQLIHRRLTKTKLIGSSQDPESQAGRQSDGCGGWWLELRREGGMGKTMNTSIMCAVLENIKL